MAEFVTRFTLTFVPAIAAKPANWSRRLAAFLVVIVATGSPALAQSTPERLPTLSAPVNDFAGVIDGPSARELDRLSRSLQGATGDSIIVATVRTTASHGDIRAYANELFENAGSGIGEKGKDNGLLILLAIDDRQVWVEVGYGLEGIITDGFAGETSRQFMTPSFRQGDYGTGLLAGARRLAARIAEARGVQLDRLPLPQASQRGVEPGISPIFVFVLVVALIILLSRGSRRRRRQVFWGGGPWSGWGGGGFGGTFGGGGGFSGGGFGGFGGGRSGGGGGGASW